MANQFPPEIEEFRQDVRQFVRKRLPDDIRRRWLETPNVLFANRADTQRWMKILYERRWAVPTWPERWHGPGWDAIRRYVFEIETSIAGAPPPPNAGPRMIGPVLMQYGSDWQKNHFLPRIAACDDYWCQGYSEPSSGSDLAALGLKAERVGDEYVINGSKIWTTVAHEADWMFALARTDNSGRKQEGITFLLIDMKTPGITIRPLPYMTGVHEFNQVFFDDARTPVECLVGKEGQGWEIAKYLLEYERGGNFLSGRIRAQLDRARRAAEWALADGRRMWDEPVFRQRYADLEARAQSVAWTELRVLDRVARGDRPGTNASYLKIMGAEMSKDATELAMLAVGYDAHFSAAALESLGGNLEPLRPEGALNASDRYFDHRANSIMGGTNEVQRTVIAKQGLGL